MYASRQAPVNNRGRARNGESVNLLAPHGRVWTEVEAKPYETAGLYTRKASINWPPHINHFMRDNL